MKRAGLLRTFVLGTVLIVGIWLVLIAVCLFGRRDQTSKNLIQNLSRSIVDEDLDIDGKLVNNLNGLNQHMWEKPCRVSLEQLCNYPIFPKAPDKRTFVENVDVLSLGVLVAGIRLHGYLRPNKTGEYYFLVASNGFTEVWLSTNKNWKNAKKIAYTNSRYSGSKEKKAAFEAIRSQISDRVILSARHEYYFEVIYVRGYQESKEHLIQVAWKRPDISGFEIIDRAFLSPYKNDSDKSEMKVYDDDLPDVLSCQEWRLKSASSNEYMRPETLPYLEHAAVKKALHFCEYQPSYLLKPVNLLNFKKYHGVHKHTHKTSSYPFPDVNGVLKGRKVSKTFIAEYLLDATEAMSVVSKYFEALKKAYPGKYKLLSNRRVEKKEDPHKGNRYLLELVVKDLTDDTSYILAEYAFQPRGKNSSLCYPKGLQWNRTADVYLILTAKNLGRWIHHFIKNVEKIVQETKDEHLHVVIYDFDSPDIDLKQALQSSILKNYQFITKPGNYSRTVSFSEAIKSIMNPDAIVVTIDLHLEIGSRLIDDVRKRCIKGKMVYAPQIVYLNCTGSSAMPNGSWYHYSYGTIATYKQDWENFGGFSKDFLNKTSWGGEDWDIIDGAVRGGLEIERKRSPWVYHYFHSKKGMWQKRNTTVTANVTSRKRSKILPPKKQPLTKLKAPPLKQIPAEKKTIVRKEVPLHKEVLPNTRSTLRNETDLHKDSTHRKDAPRQNEVLHQKERAPHHPKDVPSQKVAPLQTRSIPKRKPHLNMKTLPEQKIILKKGTLLK